VVALVGIVASVARIERRARLFALDLRGALGLGRGEPTARELGRRQAVVDARAERAGGGLAGLARSEAVLVVRARGEEEQ